ncbi:MAG: SPOR domain-containing protein [Erythrobacter sp.]
MTLCGIMVGILSAMATGSSCVQQVLLEMFRSMARSLTSMHRYCSKLAILAGIAATPLAIPYAAAAQSRDTPVAREVVQQLPTADVQRLNKALKRLARNARDVRALVDAGNASLQLGDLDAAMGFFGRAQVLEPNNADAKVGRAAVFLRSERPIEALRIYAEAEAKGISTRQVAADRGLAYDLAGNNAQAQQSYRSVLARGANPEVTRRFAISQAISGDESGFEATLLPMLERGELAAFRARAFGLAILGKVDDATSISNAVMPRDLASRIAPYLAYMPRLTKAQQAAAANLGIFPQAAEIGRDDPQIAQYAQTGTISPVANVDARLVPQGRQLGSSNPSTAASQPSGNTSRLAAVSQGQSQPAAQPASSPSRSAPAERPDVGQAFAGFELPPQSGSRTPADRVDISTFEPPREIAAPPPPSHPAREWVQVATGRDRTALRFDWRRMARNAPDLLGNLSPHVVRWGQANRLLAGPIDSQTAARDLVNALKAQGIDSFRYASPEGQEITELQ